MEADQPGATPLPAATTAVVLVRANARRANRARATLVRPLYRSLPGEPVADTEHREQIAWIVRIRLDLAAQVLDVGVDGAFVGLERNPASRTQQLSAAEDTPWLAHHGRQQLELGWRQLDPAPADRQLHARHVELDVADADQVGWLAGRLTAAQH